MKKLIALLAVVGLVGLSAFAADTTTTVTNRGEVITVKKLTDVAADVTDLTVYQNVDTVAKGPGQIGTIVRYYDYAVLGGAVGAHKLLPAKVLPDNAVILGGFVKVLTAVEPVVGCTQSLWVESAADLVAAATNKFTSTGFVSVVPAMTGASAVQVDGTDSYVTFTVAGTAATAGKFLVVLQYTVAP